jgi:peptidoglycan/xylan/chitin deacetylase (PgdA/CDA1 family)
MSAEPGGPGSPDRTAVSPGGRGLAAAAAAASERVAILTYHALDQDGSPLATAPRVFADQMAILHELGVQVIPLHEVPGALGGAPDPGGRVTITFDDGFRSVREHALPVLARYGFRATVFLVTDYCGRLNDWPDQPRSVRRRPLLDWAEVREMSTAGVAFGSHSRTHPDLTRLTGSAAETEMAGSKKAIEDATGKPVEAFAYPYGACAGWLRALARSHFRVACTADLGFAAPRSDPLALDRIDAYYLRRPGLFRRLFTAELAAYLRLRRMGRAVRRRATAWRDGRGVPPGGAS